MHRYVVCVPLSGTYANMLILFGLLSSCFSVLNVAQTREAFVEWFHRGLQVQGKELTLVAIFYLKNKVGVSIYASSVLTI